MNETVNFTNFDEIHAAQRALEKKVYHEYWNARRAHEPVGTRALAAKYRIGKSTIQRIANDHTLRD